MTTTAKDYEILNTSWKSFKRFNLLKLNKTTHELYNHKPCLRTKYHNIKQHITNSKSKCIPQTSFWMKEHVFKTSIEWSHPYRFPTDENNARKRCGLVFKYWRQTLISVNVKQCPQKVTSPDFLKAKISDKDIAFTSLATFPMAFPNLLPSTLIITKKTKS